MGELKPLLRTLAELDCTDADEAEADSMAVSRRVALSHTDPHTQALYSSSECLLGLSGCADCVYYARRRKVVLVPIIWPGTREPIWRRQPARA